jgi:hypothetical protein
MRVGSYVYMANHILADMVYGRDKWDDLLAQWCSLDLRIGVFGWALAGVVWVLRKLLSGLFRLINFTHAALSRQMEFNADLVAVRASGSDALVHALARTEFASEALDQAAQDLAVARDHRLHSRDLFFHQARAAGYLRVLRKDPRLGLPPELPADPGERTQVFQPGEGGPPEMWASHPENHEREQNAKRFYVRSPQDDRPSWLLFRSPQAVREQVTRCFYRTAFNLNPDVSLAPPEQVQALIDEEHAETTYDPRYHGLYDGRFLEPGDVAALAQETAGPAWGRERLAAEAEALYGPGLEGRVQHVARLYNEHNLLSSLQSGALALQGKDFDFRDRKQRLADVPGLLKAVEGELENARAELAALDRQVFLVYHGLARLLGGGLDDELLTRYRFHLAVQEILRGLAGRQEQVQAALQFLSDNRQIEEKAFREVVGTFRSARQELASALDLARDMPLPALKNLQAGAPLASFLLDEPLVHDLSPSSPSIDGDWVGAFLRQFGEAQERAQRIHFKGLGGILALQERILREFQGPGDRG